MSPICDYCSGPILSSHLGRPFPHQPLANYCCYGCLSLGEQNRGERVSSTAKTGLRSLGIRFGIGLLVIAQSMIFGLAVSLEEETPLAVKRTVQGSILAGTLLVFYLLGGPLLRSGWQELRRGRLTIEALFLLTLTGAMAASLQSFLSGTGPIYFEVVSVLLVVYTLGKTIAARTRSNALSLTQSWTSSLNTCRLIDAKGREQHLETHQILPGDRIRVLAGESIPIDGVIRRGSGFISRSALSGEPFPVTCHPGQEVLAGSCSYDASLDIEATSSGQERKIDHLLKMISSARESPTTLQSVADRLGRWLAPLIVLIALFTFAYWSQVTDWRTGLFHSMSVLLVACPCAIGLATPIVIWSTLSRLAEQGLVVRSGETIEKLAQVNLVCFDKTGTLTEEQFSLGHIEYFGETERQSEMLGLLALIEAKSHHPIASAFRDLPQPEWSGEPPQINDCRSVPGVGIEVTLQYQGKDLPFRVGKSQKEQGIDFFLGEMLIAQIEIVEHLRSSVEETLKQFQQMKIPVEVLTGDTSNRAKKLGLIGVSGGLLPTDKVRLIENHQKAGNRCLMIGDGINDAAALQIAHVGIALSSGTDLANGVASASLYHGDLRVIPWAVELSRESIRLIKRNLFRSVGYNLIGMTLAACGILHPIMAALLMVVSSLLVTWSSVRVGVPRQSHCLIEEVAPTSTMWNRSLFRASIHFLAFALQGILLVSLLQFRGGVALLILFGFIVVGLLLSFMWLRWQSMPHGFDMVMGMLSLGNFGMILGWFADNGFHPLRAGDCCACVELMRGEFLKPWMWLGMLFFGNLGMIAFTRRNHSERAYCNSGMFTGGNMGMILGMLLGSWLSSQIEIDSIQTAGLLNLVGMTLGMIVGMMIGSESTRRVILALAPIWRISDAKRIHSTDSGRPAEAAPLGAGGTGSENSSTSSTAIHRISS